MATATMEKKSTGSSSKTHIRPLEDRILLKPTDTAIIQGITHGWSNRSDELRSRHRHTASESPAAQPRARAA